METTRIRVAVAEDEVYLRTRLCRALAEDERIQLVGNVGTGREIIQLVNEQPVDVVLMDVEMERYESGIWAASEIAAVYPATIILFLTVHEEDELIYKAFSAAPNVDYMVKSATREEILKKVVDVFYSRNSVDPKIMRKLTREFMRLRNSSNRLMGFYNVMFTITPSEKELVGLLLQNKSVAQIAKARVVTDGTVKSQITSLLKKFHVRRSREIVAKIRELGLEELFEMPPAQ